jgi:pyridoxine kinase
MTAVTAILSIQSSVAYGHVGNSAVTFPLMRLGIEVYPVLTVHFSNHTGYGAWRGPHLAANDLAEVIRGIDERGGLSHCDAVLSGYQGGADIGEVILEAVALVKERSPKAVYCCDPVLGDVGRGLFVRPGVPELIRDRVIPAADVSTPNQYELDYLTRRKTKTLDDVVVAAEVLREMGPGTVLVTSVLARDIEPQTISMVALTVDGAWSVTTPELSQSFNGAGDLTAAMFLAQLLNRADVPTALARTAAIVFSVLAATVAAGQRELQLVAAQDEIVRPSHSFEVTRLR